MSGDYSFKEQADMHYCYGFADGDSDEAAKIYAEKFPNRDHPDPDVFQKIDLQLREGGSLSQEVECLDSDMADTEVKRRGRPKKKEVAEPVLKRAAVSNGDDTVPAKRGRGRPPKAGGGAAAKKAIVPSGRGRGRPATKQQTPSKKKKKESEDEEDNEDEEEKKDSSSVEAEDSS